MPRTIKAELAERAAVSGASSPACACGRWPPGSHSWYVRAKQQDCAEIWITSIAVTCPPRPPGLYRRRRL